MAGAVGIEPTPRALETLVLPLYYAPSSVLSPYFRKFQEKFHYNIPKYLLCPQKATDFVVHQLFREPS